MVVSGCATVTRGTTETVAIQSEPDGAKVELSSGQTSITPCSYELKRKNDYLVFLRKDGFQPVEMQIESRIAGAGVAGMAGNVRRRIIGLASTRSKGAAAALGKPCTFTRCADPAAASLCAAPARPGAICRKLLKVSAARTRWSGCRPAAGKARGS
jgi:hypothetical protein